LRRWPGAPARIAAKTAIVLLLGGADYVEQAVRKLA
jgi:hypothetical protein